MRSAMLDYFAPLYQWLKEQNAKSRKPEPSSEEVSERLCRGLRRTRFYQSYSLSAAFLALTLNQIGVPLNPKASRIWFSRKRSNAK